MESVQASPPPNVIGHQNIGIVLACLFYIAADWRIECRKTTNGSLLIKRNKQKVILPLSVYVSMFLKNPIDYDLQNTHEYVHALFSFNSLPYAPPDISYTVVKHKLRKTAMGKEWRMRRELGSFVLLSAT